MNRLDILKNLAVRGYVAPTVEVCDVVAEMGYQASLTSGAIEDATTEEWGTLN